MIESKNLNPGIESGFSLIELMISVTVLGLIFLGVSSSFFSLFRANRSVSNSTAYESIYHSYFKKIKYGVAGTLLKDIDPETSFSLKISKNKKVEAYKIANSKWQKTDLDMMLSFDPGEASRLKVNNWTFFKHIHSATSGKISDNLEIIFSRCLPYKNFLLKTTGRILKNIYETEIYPVNILGEVKCCKFSGSGKYRATASCTKLKEGQLPSTYSVSIKKKPVGYEMISFNKFINTADMDSIYALGFNGDFILNSVDKSPASGRLNFFTYKNLCKTSSHPAASCKNLKNFTDSTLLYNLQREELYSNIKLKSMSWPINVYSTLLDSGNIVVY